MKCFSGHKRKNSNCETYETIFQTKNPTSSTNDGTQISFNHDSQKININNDNKKINNTNKEINDFNSKIKICTYYSSKMIEISNDLKKEQEEQYNLFNMIYQKEEDLNNDITQVDEKMKNILIKRKNLIKKYNSLFKNEINIQKLSFEIKKNYKLFIFNIHLLYHFKKMVKLNNNKKEKKYYADSYIELYNINLKIKNKIIKKYSTLIKIEDLDENTIIEIIELMKNDLFRMNNDTKTKEENNMSNQNKNFSEAEIDKILQKELEIIDDNDNSDNNNEDESKNLLNEK